MELHVISSPCQTLSGLIEQWTRLAPYADAFHLRYKEKSEGEILEMARLLLQETPIEAKSLIINRHAAVAEELGAGGLHLTEHQVIPECCNGCNEKCGWDVPFTLSAARLKQIRKAWII
ncbi:thiamine phosphate synthase [Thermoactinomyces sp. Gus2-1]|uniref:thiamine phosphate synthase n=1 Tax=Thermoactinomyces sp. Gus2-1 TaxID=1535750 RepID=UPI00068D55CC|nr:thiamine phosphate synthase [Thermoactinomyces sp. Gus2-1]